MPFAHWRRRTRWRGSPGKAGPVVASSQAVDEPQVDSGDGRLLVQVAAGDQAAFEALYLRYRARVYGVVLTVLRDAAQAQEVTQEVFLQLWQQASRFDPVRSSTATWIQHVAHARAVDRVRMCQSATVRDTRYIATGTQVEYDTVVEQVLHGEDRASLRRSLQRLSPTQREAIVLAYYAGLSTAEISQQLGVNRSTIKTRIRDGLKQLTADLGAPAQAFTTSAPPSTRPSPGGLQATHASRGEKLF